MPWPACQRRRTRPRRSTLRKNVNERGYRISGSICPLAHYDHFLSGKGLAHHVGHTGHLLFEPALDLGAHWAGGSLRAVRGLGVVVVAAAEHVRGGGAAVSLRGRMVVA